MNAKCGMWNVEKARLVLDMMVEREVTLWNSMLSGYTQNGQAIEARSAIFLMRCVILIGSLILLRH
jgi:pentatricopeptide repeat protein